MNLQINEEDWTIQQALNLMKVLEGRKCFFRIKDLDGEGEHAVRTVIATFHRAYATADHEVRFQTSEGVITLGEVVSIEPYVRYDNNGKDRYS